MNIRKITPLLVRSAIALGLISGSADADTVVMQKQNTLFSVDGNKGSTQSGQQVYLWDTSLKNVNQQWIEVNHSGYYAFQKRDTSLCLDGGDGGRKRQAVTLLNCDDNDFNQHWKKVSVGGDSYRLEKRNASGFSIDGSRGAENRQNIYLWDSNNNNVNQQWEFIVTEESSQETVEAPPARSSWTLSASHNPDDLSNAIDASTGTRWTTRQVQNDSQWLAIDLSRESSFNSIILQSSASPNDYPRGYQVFVSGDGENWGSAIASGNGNNATIEIKFDNVVAQYIKIEQTGSVNRYWWSIHDLYVSAGEETEPSPEPETEWNVSSLFELRSEIQRNNQDIVMKPGKYNLADLSSGSRTLNFDGSNNTVNLEGVYIDVPVGSTERASYITVSGSNNTIIGGTFEDTYYNGLKEVTDFVSYNDDDSLAYGLRGAPVMRVVGDDNTVDGIKLTIRGSFPYGYGSIFGIGKVHSFSLSKRCGIVITGDSNTIENAEVQQRAFCHGIYMQEDADNTIIRNVLVEGAVRETNDMLNEGRGSLPYQENYLTVDGDPIPANEVNSLSEDGIRSYGGTGSVLVENSVVRKMRGCFRLYLASSATVRNSTGVDCGLSNFNMPNGGTITNSTGNFTYGTLNDHRLSRSRQNIEMTILASPNAIGAHNIADILGNDHDIVFHRAKGAKDTQEQRAIVVSGNNSTIRNETEYRIILESGSRGNTIISAGEVTDNGANTVRYIDLEL